MDTVANIRLTLDEAYAVEREMLVGEHSETLAHAAGLGRAFPVKLSVDARRKRDVHFVATAGVGSAPQVVSLSQRPISRARTASLPTTDAASGRPVVVGTGPAGLFAALELAEAGLCPLVVERGAPVSERRCDIKRYLSTRVLDAESNVQFGEGGAGTFSDGKLTCSKSSLLVREVLETFVAAGAPQEILWQGKPHIGTDVLGGVVEALRERIIACGGEVRFHTKLVGLCGQGGRLCAVDLAGLGGVSERVAASSLVLAIGHSARDTFEMLKAAGLELAQKPFSLGVRIEHLQAAIDEAQYGAAAGHPALGAADYKLACHLEGLGRGGRGRGDGGRGEGGRPRGVYTFCMCPGGSVVAASSEQGCLCVNGMSTHARSGSNANAALLVEVMPEDFGDPSDPLVGIAFQRTWEHAAFELGGGDWHAPVQLVGDFLRCAPGASGSSSGRGLTVEPSYPLGVREADLAECLPGFVAESLREALPMFDRKLHGFAAPGAVLTGIEARSSSPVRIVRDAKNLQATRMGGVYPCGEGAGYAGGIVSAAIDGIRVARAITKEPRDI